MSTATAPATLDDGALRHAAGNTVFERGQTYWRGGAVDTLRADARDARAGVRGSEPYEVQLRLDGGLLLGTCSCPHAAAGAFCKHQVAVALAWRAQLEGRRPRRSAEARAQVEAVAQRSRQRHERRAALAAFLQAQPAGALAAHLLARADDDPGLERELQAWRQAAGAAPDPRARRAAIDELLRTGRGGIDWPQAGPYARRARAVLPLLSTPDAAEHALRLVWRVLAQADDSDGEIGGLASEIGAAWVAALQATGPQPAAYGEHYLALQLDDPYDCFDAVAAEQAIGPAALARYREALAAAWRRRGGSVARRAQIEGLHLARLEADGDVAGALAVLRRTPDESQRRRLVDLLARHGRWDEACTEAAQLAAAHPDDLHHARRHAEVLAAAGRAADAFAVRRALFERRPEVRDWLPLLAAARAAGQRVPALRQAWLAAIAARDRGEVSLRVALLAEEGAWDEALAAVQPPAICRADLLERVARQLGPRRRAAAAALLQRVLDAALTRASSPYTRELATVREIAGLLAAPARRAWLAGLRERHAKKRVFLAGLPVA